MNDVSTSAAFLRDRLALIPAETREKEIIAIYVGLRTVEGDCDKAQGTIRTVASAWIIALLGGIGLLFQHEPSLGAERAILLRQGLLLAVSIGPVSLWYIDQRVYQRLLHSAFASGCWLEYQFRQFIPPIRTYMYSRNLEVTKIMGRFYKWPIYVILLGALAHCLAFSRFVQQDLNPVWVLFTLHAAVVVVSRGMSTRWPDLPNELPPDRMRSSI